MIRLVTLLSVVAAVAGPAAAADIHVSLIGKDAKAIHADIVAAANVVCTEELAKEMPHPVAPMVYAMNACVEETVQATYTAIETHQAGAGANFKTASASRQ